MFKMVALDLTVLSKTFTLWKGETHHAEANDCNGFWVAVWQAFWKVLTFCMSATTQPSMGIFRLVG
jgi:hypothetical protein